MVDLLSVGLSVFGHSNAGKIEFLLQHRHPYLITKLLIRIIYTSVLDLSSGEHERDGAHAVCAQFD